MSGALINSAENSLMQNTKKSHRLIELSRLTQGIPTRVELDGEGVLLCRISDQVFAVSDTCPHEDISLSLGALCEYRLRCPLHGSQFDVRTGKVLDEPAEQDLRTYPVHHEDGWICITRTC